MRQSNERWKKNNPVKKKKQCGKNLYTWTRTKKYQLICFLHITLNRKISQTSGTVYVICEI